VGDVTGTTIIVPGQYLNASTFKEFSGYPYFRQYGKIASGTKVIAGFIFGAAV
jgi:hypothetical protein